MTVVLNLYGGTLKRNILEIAAEECGLSGYVLEAEELTSWLRRLNVLMIEWKSQKGIDLGYNFPEYGQGLPEDESGIPDGTINTAALALANRIAPTIGKALSAESKSALAAGMVDLYAQYATIPPAYIAPNTPRGSGSQWSRWSPYIVDGPDVG